MSGAKEILCCEWPPLTVSARYRALPHPTVALCHPTEAEPHGLGQKRKAKEIF